MPMYTQDRTIFVRPGVRNSEFSRRRQHVCRRGTTTVEVALVLPILLLFFFGSLDFSRANSLRSTAENAAYEGARQAILPGASAADAIAAATNILNILSIDGATVSVSPTVITDSTKNVTVTVTLPLGQNLYASSAVLQSSQIVKTCKLTREQFFVDPGGT